jgi:hypothetical protein
MKTFTLLLATALAAAIPAAAAGGKTYLGACSTSQQATYKPHKIVLACGDGALYVNHIKWTSWGAKRARGHGRVHVNTCDPSCAQGHFKTYKGGKLKLFRRRTCSNGPKHQFLRARLTFSGKHPSGAPKTFVYPRQCGK